MRYAKTRATPSLIGLLSLLSVVTLSHADTATTKGGIQIKSDDGNFEARIAGRINLDGIYFIDEDDIKNPKNGGAFTGDENSNSTFSFRRARLTLQGKAYDWKYTFENDFGGQSGTTASGFRDAWIGRKILNHDVKFGQTKIYRGLEELNGSNAMLFQEFPAIGASGLFRARQIGVFAEKDFDGGGYGVSVFNTREAGTSASQGLGYNGRLFFSPINKKGKVFHIGASATLEKNPVLDNPAANIAAGGRSTSNDWRIRPRLVGVANGLRPTLVGDSDAQQSYTIEAGGILGGVYAQAEYARTIHDRVNAAGQSLDSESVDSFYVQTSYILTGESKRYDAKRGLFQSPGVNDTGVVELKARYEQLDNRDTDAKSQQYIVGLNYYFSPNTRVMLEYVDGKFDSAATGTLSASAVQTRLQYHF